MTRVLLLTWVLGVMTAIPAQAAETDAWRVAIDVPEPATLAMWSVGLWLVAQRRRRRAKPAL